VGEPSFFSENAPIRFETGGSVSGLKRPSARLTLAHQFIILFLPGLFTLEHPTIRWDRLFLFPLRVPDFFLSPILPRSGLVFFAMIRLPPPLSSFSENDYFSSILRRLSFISSFLAGIFFPLFPLSELRHPIFIRSFSSPSHFSPSLYTNFFTRPSKDLPRPPSLSSATNVESFSRCLCLVFDFPPFS